MFNEEVCTCEILLFNCFTDIIKEMKRHVQFVSICMCLFVYRKPKATGVRLCLEKTGRSLRQTWLH